MSDAELTLELVVELSERHAQVGCSSYRTQRVVLVQLGNPEDGHHGIADELLDRAAVAHEHLGHPLEPA